MFFKHMKDEKLFLVLSLNDLLIPNHQDPVSFGKYTSASPKELHDYAQEKIRRHLSEICLNPARH